MNPQDQDFPWVFRRDEIDILEDELEDLYETFHRERDVPSFESAILREQLDTEEQSDQALSGRLGFDVLEPPPDSVLSARESMPPPPDPISAWQQELSHVRVHPLFQKAKYWAAIVKPAARNGYEQGGAYVGECFRIYANVNLVVLKIFTALYEERYEDVVGFEIAYEEYRLALTYVGRILESMSFMTFAFEHGSWIDAGRVGAQDLRSELQSTLQQLARRKQSLL